MYPTPPRLHPTATALALLLTALVFLADTPLSGQTLLSGEGIRISHAGPDGNPLHDATHDGSAYNPTLDQYLIVWDADDTFPGPGATFNGKREVFGRILGGDGTAVSSETLLATLGPAQDETWDAQNPEAAFNSVTGEYFVAFVGTVASNGVAAKTEIFGQRVCAAGQSVGGPVRLSQTGVDGNLQLDSREPSVVYNPTSNEFLVVWQREMSDSGSRVEHEIYARRVSATGQPVGGERRVSTMGPNDNTAYDALDPYVAWGSQRNEYLVVWRGDDDRSPLVSNEFEIFGQRLDSSASEVGLDDFRISFMGPNRNDAFDASDPAIAYNPDLDEFLVTWTGLDDLVLGEEVYGQLLRSDGTAVGGELQISSMGADGASAADWMVDESLVAYSPAEGEYFVLWIGEDDRALLAVDEFEVFGQRLDADGAPVGIDDVRLSFLGPEGSTRYDPFSIDLAYNGTRNEMLVVYSGDDDRGSQVDDEVEIFVQRVAPRLPTCTSGPQTLCLSGGRFQVTADFLTSVETGVGQANTLTGDSGWFWFFEESNAELIVKVLDARAVNGNFWVFFGALSDVEYVVQVLDTETGEEREYRNPQGTFASVGDTAAFPLTGQALTSFPFGSTVAQRLATVRTRSAEGMTTCTPGAETLCLAEGRFHVEIDWSTEFGTSGKGQAKVLSADTGWFWFFDENNTEVMIKVLDARVINGQFWVFFGALSDTEYTVRVTDTATGAVREYPNPRGTFASVGDTSAFPGTP